MLAALMRSSQRLPVVVSVLVALCAAPAAAGDKGKGGAPAPSAGPSAAPKKKSAADEKAEKEALAIKEQALALRDRGKLDEALPLAEKYLAMTEKRLGPEDPAVALALRLVGKILSRKAEYARAEPIFRRALAIDEKALGPDAVKTADIVGDLANLEADQQHYAAARPLYERQIAIYEKQLGADAADVGKALNNLGSFLVNIGQFDDAEAALVRALAIKKKALGDKDIAVASTLLNIGVVRFEKGDLNGAEAATREALAIDDAVLGKDHIDSAVAIDNLANIAYEKGDFGAAEGEHLRALAIREKALGEGHPDVATTCENLASLYTAYGDFTRAEGLSTRALAIREKAFGEASEDVGRSLSSLAELRIRTDKAREAVDLARRGAANQEKLFGGESPILAGALVTLGRALRANGAAKEAGESLSRALAIREKALGKEHPETAVALHELATLALEAGDAARAADLAKRALAIREKTLGDENPATMSTIGILSMAHAAMGDVDTAVKERTRAADLLDRRVTTVLAAAGAEGQKRAFMETLADDTAEAISLHTVTAPARKDATELALVTILRRKGRVLDAMAGGLSVLRGRMAPEDKALFDRLTLTSGQLAMQSARGPGDIPVEQHLANLAKLTAEVASLEALVSRRSAEVRAERQPITLEAIRAAIPASAALVEIVEYTPSDPSKPAAKARPRYVAYALRRDGDVKWADLGEASVIEPAVAAFRKALSQPASDPKPSARALDALVMEPVRKLIGDARWLFVSPDGALHMVPFGAMVDAEGAYLQERYSFTYVQSGRDLPRFSAPPLDAGADMVFADPAFGPVSAAPVGKSRGAVSVDLARVKFPPLPETAVEGKAIGDTLSGARVFVGDRATEAGVKNIRSPRVLHFATHGFFLPDHRQSSAAPENALLRSGLALAGANGRESGDDDGVLTALEASHLDLRGTRVVVLSACDTGVGEARAGEGVYGLRRAFAMAGAETVVMSLWRVDDTATRQLMTSYYKALEAGQGRSEALREAELGLLAEQATSHPHYWASFISAGSPATLAGKQVTPDFARVSPGARGCACGVTPGGEGLSWGAGGALFLAAVLRRRRHRRSGSERGSRDERGSHDEHGSRDERGKGIHR